MVEKYIPERGDIVWFQFNPQSGHEQSGKRLAIVISPSVYNQKTSLLIACPITSRVKGYPFEVHLPSTLLIQGVILSDQVKSFDWRVRGAEYVCKVPEIVLDEVVSTLRLLLG